LSSDSPYIIDVFSKREPILKPFHPLLNQPIHWTSYHMPFIHIIKTQCLGYIALPFQVWYASGAQLLLKNEGACDGKKI
jgi:hypothetical protein